VFTPKPTHFAEYSDNELLGFGVPAEWLADVRNADDDTLLDLVDHLPGEAAEALLELATGGTPRPIVAAAPGADPFAHPDAQRRFRVMSDVGELAQALEYPWEKWTVFLHPEQRQIVEGDYPGPGRVSGSAGTGKTIVALHRAVHLARVNADSRILLATFSDPLASALRVKLRRLISNEPRLGERLEVHSMDAFGERLYEQQFGRPKLLDRAAIRGILAEVAAAYPDSKFAVPFLLSEWHDLVDAWQLDSWEAYRDVKRLGRKTRLPEARRQMLWSIFETVRARLSAEGAITRAGMFSRLAVHLSARKQPPFEFAVIDEAQDISVAQLKLLAALGADRPNSLFFAGDLGQRIFRQPFSWLSLGVDIRGRSRTLRVNYRTSHQIRMRADRLLGEEVSDVDGNAESRRGTISVFNGPTPAIRAFDTRTDEIAAVGGWLSKRVEEGVAPHEIGIFVRTEEQLPHARDAATQAGLAFKVLDEHVETTSGQASVCTMHLAKGLEFRAVAVMACDDEIIPLQQRIESVADDADLEEVYDTERHLLYVACTRARDQLLVTSVSPESEFLDDLRT
jgi:superfamily I DNA/RNA helicase